MTNRRRFRLLAIGIAALVSSACLAQTPISALPGAGPLGGAEIVPLVQGNRTVQTNLQQIENFILGQPAPPGFIPAPTVSTLGGVTSSTAPANQFATGINAGGAVIYAQPAFPNIAGFLACSQAPALAGDVATSAGSCASTVARINGVPLGSTTATAGNLLVANGTQWASAPVTGAFTLSGAGVAAIQSSINLPGSPTATQPACSDNSTEINTTSFARNCMFGVTPAMFGAVGGGADDSTPVENWLRSGRALACDTSYTITRVVAADLSMVNGLFWQGAGRQLCNIRLNPPSNVFGAFGAAVTVSAGGSGYIINDVAPCTGGTGTVGCVVHVTGLANNATATATLSGVTVGSFTVTAGGTLYSSTKPPAIYVHGGGCLGVKGYATVTAGAVASIAVTDPGTSCTSAPTVTIDAPASGPVGTAEIWNGGAYSVAPTNPIAVGASQRGSAGTGATFSVTFAANQPAPAGIKITAPSPDNFTGKQVVLRDFTIVPTKLIGNSPALEIDFGASAGTVDPSVDIFNVNILPSAATPASLECIRLTSAALASIKNVICAFSRTFATAQGFKGINYIGSGASTTDLNMDNVRVFFADEAFYFTGPIVQGIRGNSLTAVDCNICFHIAPSDGNFIEGVFTHLDTNANQTSFLAENAPNVNVSDAYFNNQNSPRYGGVSSCVHIKGTSGNALNSVVHDSFCGMFQVAATVFSAGVLTSNVFGSADNEVVSIHDNRLTGMSNAIFASNTSDLTIHDNMCVSAFTQMTTCINMQGGNSGFIGHNQNYFSTFGVYNDAHSSMQQPAARINSATTGNQNVP